jgi:hypothetical protein
MGSKGGQLFRSQDDPNEVVILLEVSDLAKAKRSQHPQICAR